MITPPVLLDDDRDVAQALLDRAGPGMRRRLSDLLLRSGPDGTAYATAAASAPGAGNLTLYTAWRDVLPPRQVAGSDWFADLVIYQAEDLPGGELCRSIGHWNTPGQLEVFQCLTGRVLIITARRTATGDPIVGLHMCGPGELCAVPFGAWHLTCVLDGPAAVFNLYTDLPKPAAAAGAHSSRYAATHDVAKYTTGEPVRLTAVRAGTSFMITGSDDALRTWGTGQPVDAQRWLAEQVTEPDLPRFFAAAPDHRLDHLRTTAQRCLPSAAAMPAQVGQGHLEH